MEVSHQQLFRVDKPVTQPQPKLLAELRTERVDSSYKSVEKTDKVQPANLSKEKKNLNEAKPARNAEQSAKTPTRTENTPQPAVSQGTPPARVALPSNVQNTQKSASAKEGSAKDSIAKNNNAKAGAQKAEIDPSSEDQAQIRADQSIIQQLKLRDQEVRAHEQAHASVGGQYAGTASFSYTKGPNGTLYATGGEVGISTSPVSGDPQATLAKARQVQAAALAPLNPSAQDRSVAARAGQMAADAMANLASERTQSSKEAATQYIDGKTDNRSAVAQSSEAKPAAANGGSNAGVDDRAKDGLEKNQKSLEL